MTFASYTYLRPTPARAEADTAPESPGASRIGGSGRRLSLLIGIAGLLTYAGGLPVILAEYLPR